MYSYYQQVGGEEKWKPIQLTQLSTLRDAMFVTVLSTSEIISDSTTKDERAKTKHQGPMYFDWDGTDIEYVAANATRLIEKLLSLGVQEDQLRIYATGQKGFHCLLDERIFMEKIPKGGTQNLPALYKELAYELAVPSLDFVVYSFRRAWRQPNVLRTNGMYKVQITLAELREMTAKKYAEICSKPRPLTEPAAPTLCVDLAILFDKCSQKIKAVIGKRSKHKSVKLSQLADLPSIDALMQGQGVKPGAGFHPIAMQLGIYANARNWTADQLIEKCQGLVENHESDGNRYDTPSKREAELRRMFDYTNDNPCYDFSVGAMKVLMSHPAPDLDGMPTTAAQIGTLIETGEMPETGNSDFNDMAGVVINKGGVYAPSEFGPKRITAISFENVRVLRSTDTSTISMVEADVLIDGKLIVRTPIELDIFHSASNFNKFAARLGHAFQGNDAHVRGMYLRLMERSKQGGQDNYACSREGLDVINIPNHEDERLRKPFMIWADAKGVVLEPRIADTGVSISFQGYPDPRGQYRCDLASAPKLTDWLRVAGNKDKLGEAIEGMLTCHPPTIVAGVVGWYFACFYRMLFHKAYEQFPLLHVNGSAGSGKTAYSRAMLSLFYCDQEPKTLTPSSTTFAITYCASGSASIPLVVDEYKPHEMPPGMHDSLKGRFRDAWQGRELQRGGGTRDSDDYRMLSSTLLTAPIVFIAEAIEAETALMERVVLVTMARPTPIQASRNLMRFVKFERNKGTLAVLGKYIAADIVNTYSIEKLREEFDELLGAACQEYMLQEGDVETLPAEKVREKFSAKYRSIYSFTVAKFGLLKLKGLLGEIFNARFDEKMDEVIQHIYDRMADTNAATQAEWLKVINQFVDMSYLEEVTSYALKAGREYALIKYGGQDCVEISVRACYAKYRQFCRAISVKPLYTGEASFLHGLRDASALVETDFVGGKLKVPGGSVVFNAEQLAQLGVRAFRP